MILKTGEQYTHSRRFTRNDILQFAEISQDRGEHHTDEARKIMAHGLLVATMPTKLGGDLNYIARSMEFEFLKPVFEGDDIVCTGTVEKLVEQQTRYKAVFSFVCHNQAGELVMLGKSSGLIWK